MSAWRRGVVHEESGVSDYDCSELAVVDRYVFERETPEYLAWLERMSEERGEQPCLPNA